MGDFNDLFGLDVSDGDVSFSDSKIPTGQESDSPPGSGQKPDSQPGDQKDTDLKQTNGKPDASDDGGDKGKDGDGKPLPFDQNPKWKSARAAEKSMQEMMDEFGFLDVAEMKDALASGKSLAETLQDHDVETLLNNTQAYNELQKRLEEEGDDPDDGDPNNQEPDGKLAKVLKENQQLRETLDQIKQAREEAEADEEAFANYSSDVDKIIELSIDDIPLTETEQTLFKSVMGINNPSTEVNIDDRQAVRSMVKNAVKQFHTTLEAIKQQTIDDIAAGKRQMQVTDPKKSGDLDSPLLNKKNYDPEKQSVQEVMDSGKEELIELITSASRQAP